MINLVTLVTFLAIILVCHPGLKSAPDVTRVNIESRVGDSLEFYKTPNEENTESIETFIHPGSDLDCGEDENARVDDEDGVPGPIGYDEPIESSAGGSKKIVCYYGSWSSYRKGSEKFTVDMIDPFMCTHVIYSFMGLNEHSEIIPLDVKNDLTDSGGRGYLKKLAALKNYNPDLKTMVSIGGWSSGSTSFSAMASNRKLRRRFVSSVERFLNKHGLDGLDIDWEYPGQRGGKPYDKENLVKLLCMLRKSFKRKRHILTLAAPSGKDIIDEGYDIPKIARLVDFINLMSYSYHGSRKRFTGLHAPLYPISNSPPHDSLNANWSVNYYRDLGMPSWKILLGLALYGRVHLLADPSQHDIGAPTLPIEANDTKIKSDQSYYEICSRVSDSDNPWEVFRYSDDGQPFAFKHNIWVSYEDPVSLSQKVRYAISNNLGGIMVWSIDRDDHNGFCDSKVFPLMSAIQNAYEDTPFDKPVHPPSSGQTPSVLYNGGSSATRRTRIITTSPTPKLDPTTPVSEVTPRANGPKKSGGPKGLPKCGKRNQWYFPGPSCNQYYDCTSGIARLKKCVEGLVWRQSVRFCDFEGDPGTVCLV